MVHNLSSKYLLLLLAGGIAFAACSDDNASTSLGELEEEENQFGVANDVFSADEWYPGGELGTTKKASANPVIHIRPYQRIVIGPRWNASKSGFQRI